MSAPLVVNLADGSVWTRRGSLRGGEALYAPVGVCSCPEFVMTTLPELAEHGIAGSADVLPVPTGRPAAEDDVTPKVARLRLLLAEQRVQAEAEQRGYAYCGKDMGGLAFVATCKRRAGHKGGCDQHPSSADTTATGGAS